MQNLIKHRDRFILVLFPLILTGINSNWTFTPVTDYVPDPWFYLGYFRYFYDYAPVYPSTIHYFVERLTWNIPGYYVYKTFPPLLANYILHLIVYYVAIFSLYSTLNLIFNRRGALITTLLMGSYPWFLRAAGWDYPDGTGIAHMLLLIFLITRAHYSDQWRLIFLLAGVVHSSLLIINPFWIGFFPSWVLYFLVLNHRTKKMGVRQLALAASYFLIGSLITVVVAGLFFYGVTGDYFFIKNSVRSSISLTHDQFNRKAVITNFGHLRPFWHIVPGIIAFLGTWRIFFSKQDRRNYLFLATYILFGLAYGWIIFWHFYSIPFLIIFAYSSFAIPAVFLLLGSLLSTHLNEFSERQFNLLTAASIALLLLPFVALYLIPGFENLQGNIFLISGLTLILLTTLLIPKSRTSILTSMLAFSMLYYFIGEKANVYLSNPLKGRDNFMAIISASEILDSYYPNHTYKEFRLWFRSDRNYDTFFSLAGLYLYPWGSALGNPYSRKEQPAELSMTKHDILQEGDNIVILSSNSDSREILSEANRSVYEQDAELTLVTTKTVQQGSTRFFLYFTKVSVFR